MDKEKIYSANQIAQWFINRSAMDVDMFFGEYMTNMKLQKLLYLAQCLSYAIKDKPLFKEKIQAWEFGPVVPNVYHTYKVLRANIIQDVNPVEIDDETATLLEFAYEKFGKYSAKELVKMTHNHKAYKKNYIENEKNIEIPQADIKAEFEESKESLKKSFKSNYNTLSDYAETCYVNSVPELKNRLCADDDLVEVDWKNDL